MQWTGDNFKWIRDQMCYHISERMLLASHFAGDSEHVAAGDYFGVGDYISAPVNVPQTPDKLTLWDEGTFESAYAPTGHRIIDYENV
jgi:hypothetical protein